MITDQELLQLCRDEKTMVFNLELAATFGNLQAVELLERLMKLGLVSRAESQRLGCKFPCCLMG